MAERKPKSPPRKKSPKKVDLAPVEATPVEATPVEATPVEATPVDTAADAGVAPLPSDGPPVVDHAAISARAYAIWRERGGRAFDNWLEAERQLGA